MVLLEFAMAPHGQGESLQADCPRIGMNLKVDYRAGPESRLRSKIDKVEQNLGRKLST